MTPRTRTSNKDASYKVYYSKKVPQQVRFPHKRKTVRRPQPAARDEGQMRQMEFLPEMMIRQNQKNEEQLETDAKEDEANTQEAAANETVRGTPVNMMRGRKRKDSSSREATPSDGEPAATSNKHRRRSTVPKEGPDRTLRRQSTMTQLADGRRLSTSADEPGFKPLKRRVRVSWGTLGSTERERDKKQRTLTQMIPGMGRLSKEELEELSDLDADLEDDDTDKDAVSQILLEQGLLQLNATTHMSASSGHGDHTENNDASSIQRAQESDLPASSHLQSSGTRTAFDATTEDHDEDDYQPTQYIEGPLLRARQTPRRVAARTTSNRLTKPEKSAKSRFSLLSTPEKRRVFEIPSSQSPTESLLSTQTSPEKSRRSALRERTNNTNIIHDTPSKRRQVTFKATTVEPAPPASLKKFESTIQDSEDDQDTDLETSADDNDRAAHGGAIGAETQAVLHQIDLACADETADALSDTQESVVETEQLAVGQDSYRPSPELGESWAPVIYDDDGPEVESYRSSRLGTKSQRLQDAVVREEIHPTLGYSNTVSRLDMTTQATVLASSIPSTPPAMQPQPFKNLSFTPMVIKEEFSDEDDAGLESSLPYALRRVVPEPPSTLDHHLIDLDGEPVQVPRSPSAECETQQSHSSKAEKQLQTEWLSYSQYVHARAPNSASMGAAADASSYNATPRAPKIGAGFSSARNHHSQATTIDEVTPKKNRRRTVISANITPQRSTKSQPFVSPEKPASLFIPSSFPSPSRTAMEEWSSPVAARIHNVYGTSQAMGSLEDFSIPLPPPVKDD